MNAKRIGLLTAVLLPVAYILWLGLGALDDIEEAYSAACENRIGLTSDCPGIDGQLMTMREFIGAMVVFYLFAAEGVRRILKDR
jgi:hypothetical protein